METKLLHGVPLFEPLSENEIQDVAAKMQIRQVPKGTVVLNEGDSTNSLYIILSGRVKVFLNDENGKEVILNVMDTGDYFGEVSLFDEGSRSASIMTTEDSQFAVLNKPDLLICMASHPGLALTIIKGLTLRLRGLTGSVRNLALMDVYGRVAHILLELSEEQDGVKVITEPLTQQELANRIGASSKMVGRVMKDLTTGGYITKKGKKLFITDTFPASW